MTVSCGFAVAAPAAASTATTAAMKMPVFGMSFFSSFGMTRPTYEAGGHRWANGLCRGGDEVVSGPQTRVSSGVRCSRGDGRDTRPARGAAPGGGSARPVRPAWRRARARRAGRRARDRGDRVRRRARRPLPRDPVRDPEHARAAAPGRTRPAAAARDAPREPPARALGRRLRDAREADDARLADDPGPGPEPGARRDGGP